MLSGIRAVSEPDQAGSQNLSGAWTGIYTYGHDGNSVPFEATLVEIGAALSGTIHEPCSRGGRPGEVMVATLRGSRDGNSIHFVKTYETDKPHYGYPIAYSGGLSGDATEIAGRWAILRAPGAGTFLMIRAGGRKAAVARKATVRA